MYIFDFAVKNMMFLSEYIPKVQWTSPRQKHASASSSLF